MGTNFYLRRKEPTVKDTVHIGKRSWGWLFHWDSCDEIDYPRWCDEDPSAYQSDSLPHSITCVDDIRAYLKTGEWELVDEYGEVYPDWEAEIDGFCNWDGGKSRGKFTYRLGTTTKRARYSTVEAVSAKEET